MHMPVLTICACKHPSFVNGEFTLFCHGQWDKHHLGTKWSHVYVFDLSFQIPLPCAWPLVHVLFPYDWPFGPCTFAIGFESVWKIDHVIFVSSYTTDLSYAGETIYKQIYMQIGSCSNDFMCEWNQIRGKSYTHLLKYTCNACKVEQMKALTCYW